MILANLFKLVVTDFFDDFCQLEVATLAPSAWKTAGGLAASGMATVVGRRQEETF